MAIPDLTIYAQLGGTIVTVVLFLSYLTKRDKEFVNASNKTTDSNVKLAVALQRLTDVVGSNTNAVKQNKPSVDENTGAIKDNTGAISENTNGNGRNKKG